MRGIALAGRLRRRGRREVPDLIGRDASGLLAAPVTRTGERPYPDITAAQLAAYRLAAAPEGPAPRPAFNPAPGRAPETAPMARLPVNVRVPPPPAAPARHALAEDAGAADLRLLRRVHGAMERKWRAESFLADKRELPCFAALTRELGWQGLHVPTRAAGWQRWSTEGWAARERELASAAHVQALADLDAIHARHAAQPPSPGGAR